MRKPEWTLMFRREGFQKVWLYEPLWKYEIKEMRQRGWKIIS